MKSVSEITYEAIEIGASGAGTARLVVKAEGYTERRVSSGAARAAEGGQCPPPR